MGTRLMSRGWIGLQLPFFPPSTFLSGPSLERTGRLPQSNKWKEWENIGFVYVCYLKERKKNQKVWRSSVKGQQNHDFVCKCHKHVMLCSWNKNNDKVMKSIRNEMKWITAKETASGWFLFCNYQTYRKWAVICFISGCGPGVSSLWLSLPPNIAATCDKCCISKMPRALISHMVPSAVSSLCASPFVS